MEPVPSYEDLIWLFEAEPVYRTRNTSFPRGTAATNSSGPSDPNHATEPTTTEPKILGQLR